MRKIKKTTMALLGVFIIGTILSQSFIGCKNEGVTVSVPNDEIILERNIPEIDASMPAITETATFALG